MNKNSPGLAPILIVVIIATLVLSVIAGATIPPKNYADIYLKIHPPILKATHTGGLCPEGTCTSTYLVLKDGTYVDDNKLGGKIDNSKLKKLINTTDFDEIRKNKFTGMCPTAYDGQEAIYTFYTNRGPERISSCEVQIDDNTPLFSEMKRLYLR